MEKLLELYKSLPEKMLFFDLTGLCNIKCSMCVWHNGKKSDFPKQHLDFQKFKKTIDSLVEADLFYSCINLSVSGEPSIHPKFKEIIQYLFEKNRNGKLFKVLSMNTNMVSLTPSKLDYVLEQLQQSQGQFFITCSLNAASKETSIQIKKKDCFDEVTRNTHHLIERKAQLNLDWRVKIDLQMLILKENAHEGPLFIKTWSNAFDRHGLKYSVVGNTFLEGDVINLKREFDHPNQRACDERFEAALKEIEVTSKRTYLEVPSLPSEGPATPPSPPEKTRSACPALWQTPIVRSDGQVSVCLSDIDNHMEIGGINDKSFLETWLGPKINQVRMNHLNGRKNTISICRQCTYYEGTSLDSKYLHEFEKEFTKN